MRITTPDFKDLVDLIERKQHPNINFVNTSAKVNPTSLTEPSEPNSAANTPIRNSRAISNLFD